jgi:hypothetical protein
LNKLINKNYIKKNKKPTKNGKLINLPTEKILKHYKILEKNILNYHVKTTNYKKLAIQLHFIFKYSYILTIASKMRLKTKRKVFKKYGKYLKLKKNNNQIQAYSKPLFYKPRNFDNFKRLNYRLPKIL